MEMQRLGSSIYQLWGCLLSTIYKVMDQGHLNLQESRLGLLPASRCFFPDNRAVWTHCAGDSPAASRVPHAVVWSFHFRCVHQHPLCFFTHATSPYYVWRFVPRFQEEMSVCFRDLLYFHTLAINAKSQVIGKDPGAGKDWGKEEKGGSRGWDGWMASPTQWMWVWTNSGRWWGTVKPGVLWSIGSQSQTRFSNWTATTSFPTSILISIFVNSW